MSIKDSLSQDRILEYTKTYKHSLFPRTKKVVQICVPFAPRLLVYRLGRYLWPIKMSFPMPDYDIKSVPVIKEARSHRKCLVFSISNLSAFIPHIPYSWVVIRHPSFLPSHVLSFVHIGLEFRVTPAIRSSPCNSEFLFP